MDPVDFEAEGVSMAIFEVVIANHVNAALARLVEARTAEEAVRAVAETISGRTRLIGDIATYQADNGLEEAQGTYRVGAARVVIAATECQVLRAESVLKATGTPE